MCAPLPSTLQAANIEASACLRDTCGVQHCPACCTRCSTAHLDQVTIQSFADQAALLLVAADELAALALLRQLACRGAPLPLLRRHPRACSQELCAQASQLVLCLDFCI